MGTNELDKVEALEKAATAGPWYQNAEFGYMVVIGGSAYSVPFPEDAAFIAALRNAAPALFADARALAAANARVAELEKLLKPFANSSIVERFEGREDEMLLEADETITLGDFRCAARLTALEADTPANRGEE